MGHSLHCHQLLLHHHGTLPALSLIHQDLLLLPSVCPQSQLLMLYLHLLLPSLQLWDLWPPGHAGTVLYIVVISTPPIVAPAHRIPVASLLSPIHLLFLLSLLQPHRWVFLVLVPSVVHVVAPGASSSHIQYLVSHLTKQAMDLDLSHSATLILEYYFYN